MISQINFLTPISGEQKQLHLSVLYDDVAPPACVLQTECNLGVMLYCILAVLAGLKCQCPKTAVSDKMVKFRSMLTIGIQKQRQVANVGCKDTCFFVMSPNLDCK